MRAIWCAFSLSDCLYSALPYCAPAMPGALLLSSTPQGSTIFPYLWTQKSETSSERLNELHKVLELGSNGGRIQIQISVTTGSASSYSSTWLLSNRYTVGGISASYGRLLSISMRSILCRRHPILWVPSLLEALRMLYSIPCVAIGNEYYQQIWGQHRLIGSATFMDPMEWPSGSYVGPPQIQ